MEGQDDKENLAKNDKRFALMYIGWSSLDRRTTLPMLPWLVAEIRRKSEKNESGPGQAREVQLVLIPPFIRCVPANNANSSVFIFEHKAQCISRFIHNSNDLTYFAYLIRSQPDNPESEMACHVFKAYDPNKTLMLAWTLEQPVRKGYRRCNWAAGVGCYSGKTGRAAAPNTCQLEEKECTSVMFALEALPHVVDQAGLLKLMQNFVKQYGCS